MSLPEANDFGEECDALAALVADKSDSDLARPTLFKSWTGDDVLGHLHMFDVAAMRTLDSDQGFGDFLAPWADARAGGATLTQYTARWLDGVRGRALVARWHEYARTLAERYSELDASQRVVWGPVKMSVRSLISARLMETWAHGQALFDLFGAEREEHDRIKAIAILGVNTFEFSFKNRKLEPPAETPYVRLIAPSGAEWTFNAPEASSSIEGSAVDFCRVVAQTRSVADTKLVVKGEAAHRWMAIAQCFAGAPNDPPAPGARHPIDKHAHSY